MYVIVSLCVYVYACVCLCVCVYDCTCVYLFVQGVQSQVSEAPSAKVCIARGPKPSSAKLCFVASSVPRCCLA